MNKLIILFEKNPSLLQNKGNFIIRQFSLYINPEKIFISISKLLEKNEVFFFFNYFNFFGRIYNLFHQW